MLFFLILDSCFHKLYNLFKENLSADILFLFLACCSLPCNKELTN